MEESANREVAFLLRKDNEDGNFKDGAEKFEVHPSIENGRNMTKAGALRGLKVGEKKKVGDLVDNSIFDKLQLKKIKDYTVEITDDDLKLSNGEKLDGKIMGSRIWIRRMAPAKMERALEHELQHAIDFANDQNFKLHGDDDKIHTVRQNEQSTLTNDFIFKAEKFRAQGRSDEWIENYFNETAKFFQKVKNAKTKASLKQVLDAKELFFKQNNHE